MKYLAVFGKLLCESFTCSRDKIAKNNTKKERITLKKLKKLFSIPKEQRTQRGLIWDLSDFQNPREASSRRGYS